MNAVQPGVTDLKIGDTIFHLDESRRIHKMDATPEEKLRVKFQPYRINGENSRSWLVGLFDRTDHSAAKKDLSCKAAWQYGGRGFYTAAGMEEEIFRQLHARGVADMVREAPVDVLKKIADLVGYKAGR